MTLMTLKGGREIQTADVLKTLMTLKVGGINRYKNDLLRRVAALGS
jgi:hypothetical protein